MLLVKRLANRSLDWLLFNRFLEPYWLNRMKGRVLCLLYHRVDVPGQAAFLDAGGVPVIAPDEFAADIRFLTRRGARFLRFADLRAGDFPARDEIGVVICFDDGFIDNYTTALEVLDCHDIRATIFQCTAMIDGDALLWEHKLYWYAAQRPHALHELAEEKLGAGGVDPGTIVQRMREECPAPQVEKWLDELDDISARAAQRDLAVRLYPRREHLHVALKAGHEIGSHGHNHYKRFNIGMEPFEQELKRSHDILAALAGQPPGCFSYPFNSYRPGDGSICARYFEQVVTVDGGFMESGFNPLAIPRATWPGVARNEYRRRRWLLTGHI